MTYATKIDGAWVALTPYQPVTIGDGTLSWDSVASTWSDADREANGVFAVPEPAAPSVGKIEAFRKLTGTTRPKWAVTYADAPPPGPAPVPDIISTRQFFQQLAVDGDCTKDDALAYVRTGVLPKVLADVIATLPADAQFAVNMQVIGANEFNRTAEAVALLGQLLQKDGAALDRIWREAAKL